MKVLLINAGSLCVTQKPIMPLGLLSIATYLKENGHSVRLIDRTVENKNVEKEIKSFEPDIVGVSLITFMDYSDAIKLSEIAKKYELPVVWGGQTPSLAPEQALGTKVVDFVVVGDGEIAMLELMNAINDGTPLREIAGLVFYDGNEIVRNEEREMVDLALFPIIDFTFIDPKKYLVRSFNCEKTLHIYSSKGCTGQCTYCYSPYFSKRLWRPRPIDYVVSEIKYLADHFDIDGITFADDIISPNEKYLSEFCKGMREGDFEVFWSCSLRADTCKKETLQMLYDSGCRSIFFGIESGSKKRQKTIKKNLDLDKTELTVNNCKEIGILTTTSFIVGYPGETEEELKDTIKYINKLNSDVKIAALYGVIPKSEMYEQLLEEKVIDAPQSHKEWEALLRIDKVGRNFSKISDRELRVIQNYFLFRIITDKQGANDEKSRLWFKRLVHQTFDILKIGSFKALYMFILSGLRFLQIVFYATMFPGVREKYGLKKRPDD